MISCLKTVFIDSSYMTGYFSITICMSKSAGSLDRMSSASSSTTSYNTKCEYKTTRLNVVFPQGNKCKPERTNLRRLGPATRLSWQSQQNSIKELIGLLVILCDVSVAMKSEHTGIGTNWKTASVVNIRLE